MLDYLVQLIETKDWELNSNERNLLTVDIKNYINSTRTARRTVQAIIKSDKYTKLSSDWFGYKLIIIKNFKPDVIVLLVLIGIPSTLAYCAIQIPTSKYQCVLNRIFNTITQAGIDRISSLIVIEDDLFWE